MSDVRWLALVWLPNAPDKFSAESVARSMYGGDVMMVQSFASWKEGVGEQEARRRADRNHWVEDDEADDQC